MRCCGPAGCCEPAYGGPLRRHVADGNSRLLKLRMDNSPAALRLWNFLLSEEERLHQARKQGKRLVGTMKDLGTVPVMAYSLDDTVAFYADGAWWLPCLMENRTGMLELADQSGHRRLVLPRAGDVGRFREQGPFPLARPRHLQRGGDLRRHGGDCPAAGRLGLRHLLVGDAASPAPGPGRAGRDPARRFLRAAKSSGPGPHGTGSRAAGFGIADRANPQRRAAGRRHRPGESRAVGPGRSPRVGVHGPPLPDAGLGNAHCRDVGHSFLLRPGGSAAGAGGVAGGSARPACRPARARWRSRPCGSFGSIRWPICGS